jgi:ATP/maltotriose-dependent transcriptional regulator MalT
LTWFAERRDGKRLARLATALCPFWEERAHYAEGRRWLETALEMGSTLPARDRLPLLSGAGTMAWRQSDFARAIPRHEEALILARELGDREAEAFAINNLGVQAAELGKTDEARERYETCLMIAREVGEPRMVIYVLHNLAQVQRVQRETVAAKRNMEEALALAREHAMNWIVPYILDGLGLTAADLGEYDRAIALLHESIAQAQTTGNPGIVIYGIEGLANVAAATGQPEQAVRLLGAADAWRERLAYPLSPSDITYAEPVMTSLRTALGADGFRAAWADGRLLSQEEALAEALAIHVETVAAATPGKQQSAPHGLTERELEVLRLLAAGQSNSEIGEALFISPSTAARHVANIYNKLGVDSRAKATAYAHQHGLV